MFSRPLWHTALAKLHSSSQSSCSTVPAVQCAPCTQAKGLRSPPNGCVKRPSPALCTTTAWPEALLCLDMPTNHACITAPWQHPTGKGQGGQ